MSVTLIILLVAAAAVWIWRVQSVKGGVIKDGTAIERKDEFFKQKHIFSTNVAALQEVASAMDKSVLEDKKISYELSSGGKQMAYRNHCLGGSFTASLDSVGQNTEDGKNLYIFQVHSWRENKGIAVVDIAGANVLLTTIERAFLKLDPDTTVRHENAKYKAKLF